MDKKIVFFEIEDDEKDYIIQRLGNDNIMFFTDIISNVDPSQYADVNILSGFIYSKISKEVLDNLHSLQFIATRSTGYDHIAISEAIQKGILISNVPVYGENTVAEHTFALILALSRHIPESIENTKKGIFTLEGLQGFDLKGKTIGVIGTGNIGLHVIRIAAGFEMHILAASRTQKQELIDKFGVRYVELPELLSQSDIITLHIPDNEQTHHIINMDNIHTIKHGAIIINTSRGGLIDTNALVKALDEGIIAAAGLDVLEEEGLIKEERELLTKEFKQSSMLTALENHFLLSRPNVLVTPHNAFNSKEAIYRILDTTIENILAFKEGRYINSII